MPYSNIDKPSKYFNTVLYTGNNIDNTSITGVGFKPDWVWLKARNQADYHYSMDSVRGALKALFQNSNDSESTFADSLKSFDTDGFTLGTSGDLNASSQTMVAWNWLGANTTVSNTSGTITSTVSANTTSGFSIVAYQGTSVAGTIGHGLGVAPKMIIIKRRTAFAEDWLVYHSTLGATKNLKLNTTAGEATSSSPFNNTAPTSTVFSVESDGTTNSSSSTYIAYCFAEVKGFSKFGSYVGNGSTDGTFIYTGFKPAFVMVKASSTTGQWAMCDTKRGVAPSGEFLFAESNEATNSAPANWDFVSNGLKARANYAAHITSGVTYIYMAFAENPFVSSKSIPTTAR